VFVDMRRKLPEINNNRHGFVMWKRTPTSVASFRVVTPLHYRYERMFASLERVAGMRRELDAMEAAWLRVVAEYDRSDDWRAEGYASAASAIRHVCRMNVGTARAQVEPARILDDLPVTAAAFGEGDISHAHARVIADAYTPERAAELEQVEPAIVDVARAVTPRELLAVVRRITDAIDGDGGAATDEALHARRQWHMSRTLDGMLAVDGLFDPEAALIHETAIRAQMDRDYHDGDARSAGQRRADAVTELFRRSLDVGLVGGRRAARPHVTVVVDLDRLLGTTPDLIEQARADRRDGGLSAATLERLTCDCDVSRVITAGPSEVLDAGRATRTISPALWRALVVRDAGCKSPGCHAPAEHCEAHHIVHWARGGATDLENLRLLCSHHHRQTRNFNRRRHTDALPRAA
jgi:hypothetical protein